MNLHFVVPGDPQTLTGGYLYDRRIVEGLPACGVPVRLHALPDGFPDADAAMLRAADALLRSLPDASVVVVDGLAFGAMPWVARTHAQRLKLVSLVHHPLSFETGLAPARARWLADSERDALACARKVIVPSRATAQALAAPGPFGVPAGRIAVVEPGTDPAPYAGGSAGRPSAADGAGLSLLCVATLTPRKGHLQLLDALWRVRDRRWTLHCVGSAMRDPSHARAVAARIEALALAERVTIEGELDRASLDRHLAQADAFVLASVYEGYGMAFAEALARGLPVIGTRVGAIAQTVPACAGLLVQPGDVDALAAALARFLDDPALRRRLAEGALRARTRLPDWPSSCRRFARVVRAVAHS
ncbi:MAG: glycosyltransferase family 1 protein [Burkholderiales bacterium]|nr:MAG: glycosyltransferase family 1 protein [Burkholderiales bacterium]